MLDEISLKILSILQEKARIPNVEVARKVGLAPSAVLERIRKLERQGYIDGYEVRLNPEKFERPLLAFVHVMVEQGPDMGAVGDDLAALPEVLEVHFVSGEDGYLVKMRLTDAGALARIIQEQIAVLPHVRATRTTIVLSTLKETWSIPIGDMPPP